MGERYTNIKKLQQDDEAQANSDIREMKDKSIRGWCIEVKQTRAEADLQGS